MLHVFTVFTYIWLTFYGKCMVQYSIHGCIWGIRLQDRGNTSELGFFCVVLRSCEHRRESPSNVSGETLYQPPPTKMSKKRVDLIYCLCVKKVPSSPPSFTFTFPFVHLILTHYFVIPQHLNDIFHNLEGHPA